MVTIYGAAAVTSLVLLPEDGIKIAVGFAALLLIDCWAHGRHRRGFVERRAELTALAAAEADPGVRQELISRQALAADAAPKSRRRPNWGSDLRRFDPAFGFAGAIVQGVLLVAMALLFADQDPRYRVGFVVAPILVMNGLWYLGMSQLISRMNHDIRARTRELGLFMSEELLTRT